MDDLKKFPRPPVTAVAQCSGNSRGRFAPGVLGGQWGDGAMGNAGWTGARLQDVLKAVGARSGGLDVTFDGLDKPAFPTVPDFVKALDVQRIMNDPDVIVAYEMNGQIGRASCRGRVWIAGGGGCVEKKYIQCER